MYELLIVNKYGQHIIETLDTIEECEDLINYTAEYEVAFIYELKLIKSIRGTSKTGSVN